MVSRSPPFSVSTSHVERATLDVDEVGDVKGLVQTREGAARPEGVYARHGRRLLVGSEADGMGEDRAGEKARTTKIAQRYAHPARGLAGAHGPHPGPAYVAREHDFGRLRLSADGV